MEEIYQESEHRGGSTKQAAQTIFYAKGIVERQESFRKQLRILAGDSDSELERVKRMSAKEYIDKLMMFMKRYEKPTSL